MFCCERLTCGLGAWEGRGRDGDVHLVLENFFAGFSSCVVVGYLYHYFVEVLDYVFELC